MIQINYNIPYSNDENIRKFYKEFESTYLIFNPFLELDKNLFDVYTMYKFKNYSINKKQIIFNSKIIMWRDILNKIKLDNFSQINKMLLSNSGAIRLNFEEKKFFEEKELILNRDFNIISPSEGIFPNKLENLFLSSFIDNNINEVIISNEFNTNSNLIDLKSIDNYFSISDTYRDGKAIFDKDKKILYTIHWDSFFTMLSSYKDVINNIISKYSFEGFFCDDNTNILW